ncbi:MAG: hypothetical protein ACK526_13625 [Planctomyces sp.]|jgi:type II secretory pathway component PulK
MKNTLNHSLKKSEPRAGFILVMVLVLLLLTSLSVAGFARKSLILADSVAVAQETLQRRWGIQTCRRLLLQNSEQLLDGNRAANQSTAPLWPTRGMIQGSFLLGGLRFEFQLSDEDAKVNLNAIASGKSDPMAALTAAVRQSSGRAGMEPQIRWSPQMKKSQKELPFRTWQQVFNLQDRGGSQELADRLQQATGEITCWGSGRLNLRRASDRSVETVCQSEIGEDALRKLLVLRKNGGFGDLDDVLSGIALRSSDAFAIRRLLATESKCYSLWLTVRNSRRSWTSFTIDTTGSGKTSTFESFVW